MVLWLGAPAEERQVIRLETLEALVAALVVVALPANRRGRTAAALAGKAPLDAEERMVGVEFARAPRVAAADVAGAATT